MNSNAWPLTCTFIYSFFPLNIQQSSSNVCRVTDSFIEFYILFFKYLIRILHLHLDFPSWCQSNYDEVLDYFFFDFIAIYSTQTFLFFTHKPLLPDNFIFFSNTKTLFFYISNSVFAINMKFFWKNNSFINMEKKNNLNVNLKVVDKINIYFAK